MRTWKPISHRARVWGYMEIFIRMAKNNGVPEEQIPSLLADFVMTWTLAIGEADGTGEAPAKTIVRRVSRKLVASRIRSGGSVGKLLPKRLRKQLAIRASKRTASQSI